MNEYIKVFSSVSDYNTFKASASYHTPNISYISGTDVVLYNPTIEYPLTPLLANVKNYLSFVAQASGTFLFSNAVDYSVDNGITWSTLASNTASPTVAAGSKIMWKATLTPTSSGIGTFSSTANFIVQGNVMSLLYGDNFSGLLSLTGKDYAFKDLFAGCTGITNAYKLSLPATTLSEGCYKNMFKNCTGMVIAPNLLAVTLADSCYSNMFYGCTSLTESPELSAAILDNNCYEYMFYGCSSLTDIKCLATDITATDCTTNWVNGVASSGMFVKDSTMSSWTTGNNGIPTNWTINGYQDDYSSEYLTFEALETGSFTYYPSSSSITTEYSTDNGSTWNTLTSNQWIGTVPAGTKILWRSNGGSNNTSDGIGRFYSSGNFNIYGNILSIVYGANYYQYETIPEPSSSLKYGYFKNLFNSCKIIHSDKLFLPTTLEPECYCFMFDSCTRMITTPKLSSTSLENKCYQGMFKNCSSLVTAPQLPATTLRNLCYELMFMGCTSLVNPPELPSMNIPNAAYLRMFKNCTSLINAPDLLAPSVTAVTYALENSSAYYEMFEGCSNLIYVKCLVRATSSICLYTWMSGVHSGGTFVKAAGQAYYNGIPDSWTVLEE